VPAARRARVGRARAALLAGALFACGTDYFQAYSRAHPGWRPDYPRESISVAELFASLHAPTAGRNTLVQVTHARVLALGSTPWETIPARAFRDGAFEAEAGRLYVVAARVECSWSRRGLVYGDHGFVWYVVRDDRLLAYRHVDFEEYCHAERSVRGSVHAVEGFEEKLEELMSSTAPARAGDR
jgi:hypothetical protein